LVFSAPLPVWEVEVGEEGEDEDEEGGGEGEMIATITEISILKMEKRVGLVGLDLGEE